jgi:hypothetical protein
LADQLRRNLLFVIDDFHHAGGEIYIAALHAGKPASYFFHGRAARCAVHSGNFIFFLFHKTSFDTLAGYLAIFDIYPNGVFVKRLFLNLSKVRKFY